ncbi:unnamed protein product [Mortierella alpina]
MIPSSFISPLGHDSNFDTPLGPPPHSLDHSGLKCPHHCLLADADTASFSATDDTAVVRTTNLYSTKHSLADTAPCGLQNLSAFPLPPSAVLQSTLQFNHDRKSQPPDGGLKAWSVVLGSVLIQTFAFAPTEFIFGVFVQEYLLQFPPASPSSIALIGTIGTSTTYLVGFFTGTCADRWGYRVTACSGTLIMTAALVLASFSTQLWHLYLSQGVLFGAGASLVYFSAIAAPTHWFKRRRGLAMGIAASGSGLGGFFLAPLTQFLADRIGIHWTLRVLGAYSLLVCGIASLLLFEREKSEREPQIMPLDNGRIQTGLTGRLPAFSKEMAFMMLVAFQFLLSMAYLTPIYFMESPLQVSSVLGIVYGFSCVALLCGSLISGQILEMTKPQINYLPVIMYSGGMFAASALFATSWMLLVRRRGGAVVDSESGPCMDKVQQLRK